MTESRNVSNQEVKMDRRWKNRRAADAADDVPNETTTQTAAEPKLKRRKKERRRQIDPTTCERDYNSDEINFMRALDEYKRTSGRMFPTCSEILEVVMSLGYVKLNEEEQQIFDSIREVENDIAEACSPTDEAPAEPRGRSRRRAGSVSGNGNLSELIGSTAWIAQAAIEYKPGLQRSGARSNSALGSSGLVR